jgi:tetratricopeptide (TPR) repeat protein
MNFGGHTTTYEVSDPNLVNTYDLGPNNTRVVTLRFEKEAQLPDYKIEIIKDSLKSTLNPSDLDATDNPKKNDNYAYIYMIKTYERVAEKGYKSVDIFQKLGNYYYYNNELYKATKCYDELFVLTSDVEPEYYYRYAQCLQSKGQNDKANEMLEIFNRKSEIKSQNTSRK